jgi:hypothetical protein
LAGLRRKPVLFVVLLKINKAENLLIMFSLARIAQTKKPDWISTNQSGVFSH